ncbi:MAG: methylated-DNA--[protein]-cysteine S-methyltransferase [Planctomycetota bacterium]
MTDFDRVARVIDHLNEHRRAQPSLEELAALVELSPAHFQRLFVRWAGVSPKKFLQLLTVKAVRRRLRDGQSVLDAALDEGLSGPGRLHDLTVSLESASPGEIKAGGEGWKITAGYADTPFGQCLVAITPRGICRLDFVEKRESVVVEQEILTDWPNAGICWNDNDAELIAARIFKDCSVANRGLRCFVRGSQFQVRVWRALLKVPPGQLATYQQIATAIGRPDAYRAVGTAVGSNPIGYLIPCHRIIKKTGIVGQYRWGEVRKHALLGREFSQLEAVDAS